MIMMTPIDTIVPIRHLPLMLILRFPKLPGAIIIVIPTSNGCRPSNVAVAFTFPGNQALSPARIEGNHERLQTWYCRCHEAVVKEDLCGYGSVDGFQRWVGTVEGVG